MFVFFSSNKAAYEKIFKKAQLAPFFIALITAIIILILFSINLSKISLFKVHTANASDAGALAAASQLAFTFNQLALAAAGMYASYMAYMAAIGVIWETAKDYLENAKDYYNEAMAMIAAGIGVACVPYVGKYLATAMIVIGDAMLLISEMYFGLFQVTVHALDSAIDDMYNDQKRNYRNNRKAVEDNYESSFDIGRDYVFLNSGIGEKLNDKLDINGEPADRDGDGNNDVPSQADEFSFFVQDKNTPSTFCWRDGMVATTPENAPSECQGSPSYSPLANNSHRLHVVSVDIDDPGPPTTYQLIKTKWDKDEIDDLFEEIYAAFIVTDAAILAAHIGLLNTEEEISSHSACYDWIITVCFPFDGCWCIVPGSCLMMQALVAVLIGLFGNIVYEIYDDYLDQIWESIQENGTFCDNTGNTGDRVLVTITDVDHIYDQLKVETKQKHQGQDLGLWETKYPKVTSKSRASYACDTNLCDVSVCNMPYPDCGAEGNCGDICSHSCSCINGKNNPMCMMHQPVLVGVDEFQ